MRHCAPALAFALIAASSSLAAPHYHQDRKLDLAPVRSSALQRRTAINTGNGNSNENNGDEDEDDLEASEPEELPGLEGQAPQVPDELEDLQEAQREQEQEEASDVPSEGNMGSDISPLPRELTEIVEQQARFMTLLYLQQGLFFNDLLFVALARDIPYLTEQSARQIITETLTPITSADSPESVASQLIEDQLNAVTIEEVEQQLQAIVQFISDNSDLSRGTAAPNLVQLAENQTRLLANKYARNIVPDEDLLTGLLRRQNPYLTDERTQEIAREEIAKYFESIEGEEGGPSLTERFRNWWRNRGSGGGGGGSSDPGDGNAE